MQECVLCREHITNPICPECIGEQIKTWLAEVKPDLVSKVDLETSKMSQHLFEGNKCVICFNDMDICTYCYTEHIFDWLSSLKIEKKLLEQFMLYFNFDLCKKGYYDRALKKAIIC